MALKLASAQTATGVSQAQEVVNRASTHSWQVVPSGTVTTLTIVLEGSNDGTTFTTLGTTSTTTGTLNFVTAKPVKFVRSNITTISGAGATISVLYTPGDI